MDDMARNADHALAKPHGIARLSTSRGHRRALLHRSARKQTRAWRRQSPKTPGNTGCCIRSKSSRFAIHPFRDVNTRSQHVFFTQLARDAGWVIDWSQIPGDVFAHARTLAIVEDHSGLDALIRPNLVTVEDAEQRDRLIQHLKEHTQGFTTRKTARGSSCPSFDECQSPVLVVGAQSSRPAIRPRRRAVTAAAT